jgi:hypothetical protein
VEEWTNRVLDLQEVEIEYNPDAEYKRQLEESIPE